MSRFPSFSSESRESNRSRQHSLTFPLTRSIRPSTTSGNKWPKSRSRSGRAKPTKPTKFSQNQNPKWLPPALKGTSTRKLMTKMKNLKNWFNRLNPKCQNRNQLKRKKRAKPAKSKKSETFQKKKKKKKKQSKKRKKNRKEIPNWTKASRKSMKLHLKKMLTILTHKSKIPDSQQD